MAGEGLALFAHQFYGQFERQGLIVDARNNGGGFVSQMVLERLGRRLVGLFWPRHGAAWRYPARAPHAHMVVLIDEHAGSDGDIFPAAFRRLGLGTLVGTRTWGGTIGTRPTRPFVDRGQSTQPEFAWWEPEGGWTIENEGVAPDVVVPITPADRAAGRDPQLDRAIEIVMAKLRDEPKALPDAPPPARND
jgi:tricorn protease